MFCISCYVINEANSKMNNGEKYTKFRSWPNSIVWMYALLTTFRWHTWVCTIHSHFQPCVEWMSAYCNRTSHSQQAKQHCYIILFPCYLTLKSHGKTGKMTVKVTHMTNTYNRISWWEVIIPTYRIFRQKPSPHSFSLINLTQIFGKIFVL